jgi:hypothetical protein
MRSLIAAALAAVLVATPVTALGQEGGAARPQQVQGQAVQQAPRLEPLPTPADLGISINRIRRELREIPPVKSTLLRYDFHVDVYGHSPKVDFFKDFDLSPKGAVRYGGMTHAEFLNVVTPQAYRAPSGDLLGLAAFAIQQLTKKKLGGSDK